MLNILNWNPLIWYFIGFASGLIFYHFRWGITSKKQEEPTQPTQPGTCPKCGSFPMWENNSWVCPKCKWPKVTNHYIWLEKNLSNFMKSLEIHPLRYSGLITAHGDKCEGYKSAWEKAGIPFEHGVALYLLSHIKPYSGEVRQTSTGWVDIKQWVIDNYPRFKDCLPPV
jgi:hypothetical protein